MNDHEASSSVPDSNLPAAPLQPQGMLNHDEKHAPVRRTRPTGIVAVVVLMVAQFLLFWYVAYNFSEVERVRVMFSVFLVASGCIAVGLWLLHAWARIGAIMLCSIYLWIMLPSLRAALSIMELLNLLIPVAIIMYLLRPHVRKAFR